MEEITFNQLSNEGLVFLGCGGDINQWTSGIQDALPNDAKDLFDQPRKLITSGGRIDLVYPFKNNGNVRIPMSLVMWRLSFGDCSWISDYKVNYQGHHNVCQPIQQCSSVTTVTQRKKNQIGTRELKALGIVQ
jgi:hypothetical protein